MAVINTNVKALFSQMALKTSGLAQSTAMQQLSTGKRINSARDDAAGMAIATRMTHQIRSLNQAVRNAGDAISLIQTAEGATNEITDMLQRMRELSIQAVNDTNDNAQRSYLDLEFQQLKQQIVQIADNTEWNGFPLLSGKAGQQVGEMPVYKATSQNLTSDGAIFVNPTTTRTLEGAGVGEQQKITFTAASLPAALTGTRTLNVGGVDVTIDVNNVGTVGALNTRIKEVLDQSATFGSGSGRTVSLETSVGGAANDTLVINYSANEGHVNPLSFNDGTTNIVMNTPTTTRNAVVTAKEDLANNGKFLKSGTLTIEKSVDGVVTANFLTADNQTISMVGNFSAATGKVVFGVTDQDGANSSVISDTLTYTLKDASGATFDGTSPELDLSPVKLRALKLSVDVAGSIPAMHSGDLLINGVDIGGSFAADDKLSPVNNASGSAIAKAAAINRKAAAAGTSRGESQSLTFSGNPSPGTITVGGVSVTLTSAENTSVLAAAKVAAALRASPQFGPSSGRTITYPTGGAVVNIDFPVSDGDVGETTVSAGQTALKVIADTTVKYSNSEPGTGVFAKVNENVFSGKAMTGNSVVRGAVFINGYASANIVTALNNPRETRANVVKAINLISDRTGVKAIDTGTESSGVTLVAADGRNIEVRFETDANAAVFGDRIGMREGVQSSTISLESKIPAAVVLSNTAKGDISRVGLTAGNFSKNQSVYSTVARPIVESSVAQVSKVTLDTGTVAVGDKLTVVINSTPYTYTAIAGDAGNNKTQAMRAGLINLINNANPTPNVTVTAGNTVGELLITSKVPGTPFTLSTSKTLAATSVGTISSQTVTENKVSDTKNLGMDDLQINGVAIRPATTADDLLSNTVTNSSNRSASAIALAAAINASTPETGVKAVPNAAVIQGKKTITTNTETMIGGTMVQTAAPVGVHSLYLNGIEVKVDFKLDEDPVDRRMKVVNAINERTGQHGVTAEDNGNGVTLKTDGRNLSVWFDSNDPGLSPASFGLDQGSAKAQVSKVSIGGTVAVADTVSVSINGVLPAITATVGPVTAPATNSKEQAAIDLTAAINSTAALKNLVAYVDPDDATSVLISSKVPGSPFDLRGATTSNPLSTLALGTAQANDMGNNQITGIRNANESTASARTLYGSVSLIGVAADLPAMPGVDGLPPSMVGISGKPITISTGADGFSSQSNFAALGFQVGSFGGRSSEDMDPPRIGRLAFQVGASANQTVTIDLADFGKKGPITGDITGDVDLAVENRTTRINTSAGATAVLNLLDVAMDKVNATRATMGAVMNRLDHVINNLTNVSMNMSASRSQIEDADYASASTELAKTQIMQQAATAVLAQANTSQQTVLKLLGG